MTLAPQPATFPFYLHLGPYTIHPHFFFESLSYIIAFAVYLSLRRRFGDSIATPFRWAAVAAAVAGAAIGAKILFWLEDPQLTWQNMNDPAYLIGGKTIVGALAGGLISVELIKRYIGIRTSTGDLYAIPLALGIAIGRIGCFLTGLSDNTYGTPTNLPWAVNFGDGIPRHPTQLYEMIFLLALIPFLYQVLSKTSRQNKIVVLSDADAQSKDPYLAHRAQPAQDSPSQKQICHFEGAGANATASRETCFSSASSSNLRQWQPGDAFKLFMVAYVSFRLLCDFLKPYPRIFLGLGGIQWACVLLLLYYSRDVARWLRLSSMPKPQP
ncbi:MAG: prolipoprotein diacylglyceryl transferase family protein [Candidatus Sulfotelmatobacter sp.]